VKDELTAHDLVLLVGVALVIVGSFFGVLMQSNIWTGTSSSTIAADTVDPVINEAATSSGNIPTTTTNPVLLCFVEDAGGIASVTAEIKRPGVGWELWQWMPVETLDLDYISRNGDVYKYKTELPNTLELNTEYRIVYTATDNAGRTDTYTTEIQLIELMGTVWVNDIEVTSPDQTIWLQTHTIAIEAEINQDPEDINRVQLLLDGTEVEVLEYRYSSKDYFASYQLPADGKYELLVQVLAVGGDSIRLASFNIDLSSGGNPVLLAGAAAAVLAVSAVLIYLQRRQEA